MSHDYRKDIFQAEYELLDSSKKVMLDPEYSGNRILPQFENLLYGFSKLLQQSSQLVSISDRQQTRLFKLQDELTNALMDLHRAKEAADAASQSKSTFLANMSHEIRTPMNAILGFSQLLQIDKSFSEKQRGQLDSINRSGEHLLALINDILEISKIEAGRITLNPTNLDLQSLIRDMEMMFTVRTDEKKLLFTVQIPDDTPKYIVADEGKLKQILINLLGNAVKFTQEGGITLRIHTERTDDTIRLVGEVEDTGVGIAPEEMCKLFIPFEQTSSGSRSFGGTGLGLAISRTFAGIMGGDIFVTSELGKGSCFRFEINVLEGEAGEAKERQPAQHVTRIKPGQEPFRVLIVDDDIMNRIILQETLGVVGFETCEAVNGEDAVTMFTNWHPDIILMDIKMPVVDGKEATQRIRALETGKTIPIIAVTASAFEHEKEGIFEAGLNGYISKPFDLDEVYTIISEHLDVTYEYESVTEEIIDVSSETDTLTFEATCMKKGE